MKFIINFFDPKHYGRFSNDEIPEKVKDYISHPLLVFKITFIICTLFFITNFAIGTSDKPDWLIMIFFFEALSLLLLSAFHILLITTYIIFAIADYKYIQFIAQKTSVILINVPISIIYIHILNS